MSSAAIAGNRLFEQAAHEFHAEGFCVLREFFSAEDIAALDADATLLLERRDLMDTNNIRCRWQDDVETGACVFDAFDPVIDLSSTCAQVANDSRIYELLHAIYGGPGRLFKDKLIFKPPGARGYALHQDFIAWPTFPRSFLSIVVAIDPSDAANGCVEVFPKYHLRGCLTSEDGNYHEIPAGVVDDPHGVKLKLAPGDIAVFGGFTPHRSAPNRSRHWRRSLYLSYNADSDGGDYRATHYQEFHAWLREQYAKYGRTDVFFT
jgi:ectoine hydroxylase-related dioxygenase (phytanoyl-CoA dioxygenase family)